MSKVNPEGVWLIDGDVNQALAAAAGSKVLLTVCLISWSPGTPPTGHPSKTFPKSTKTHVDWCGELPHTLSERRSHDPPTQRSKNMIGDL